MSSSAMLETKIEAGKDVLLHVQIFGQCFLTQLQFLVHHLELLFAPVDSQTLTTCFTAKIEVIVSLNSASIPSKRFVSSGN